MRVRGLALHVHPEYEEACSAVLNEEWPRNATARLHMLSKSSDQLPYNIVYVLDDNNGSTEEVIGHSRLCKVHGQRKSCFIESVVIKKTHRGKGYGGTLMRETEEHARKLGFETAYLTTHDKQDFYGHVGYEFCQPVVSLGSASTILSEKMIERLFGNMSTSANDPHHSKHDVEKIKPRKTSECSPSVTAPLSPPPPAPLSPPAPPPPPALVSMPMADGLSSSGNIYWMKKSLVCL